MTHSARACCQQSSQPVEKNRPISSTRPVANSLHCPLNTSARGAGSLGCQSATYLVCHESHDRGNEEKPHRQRRPMSQWNLNEGNEPVGPEAGNCPALQDIPVPLTRPSPLALGPDGARGSCGRRPKPNITDRYRSQRRNTCSRSSFCPGRRKAP